ncbi:MAG: YcjF family protein [Cyanobacteriota bacterium]
MTTIPESDSLEEKLTAIAHAERLARAQVLVKNYTLGAASLALLPFPIVDQLLLVGLGVKMVHDLCRHYDVAFKANLARAIIASLLSGLTGGVLAGGISSLSRTVPVLGTLYAGRIAISSASITFALGTVFINHFESNGTLLKVDPEWFKEVFHHTLRKNESAQQPDQSKESAPEAAASPA